MDLFPANKVQHENKEEKEKEETRKTRRGE